MDLTAVSGTKTRFLAGNGLYTHIHPKYDPIDLKIGPVVQHTSLFGLTGLHLMKTTISRFFLLFPPRTIDFQEIAM